MLTVISPAKRLDETPAPIHAMTDPIWQDQANTLAGHARQLTLKGLQDLMSISPDLARLNRDRFRAFSPEADTPGAKQAALMFDGDTYTGLEANTLDADAMAFAQDRLRILSGLYGLLRPLDRIQPYRLEMGSRLKTRRGTSLYDFWGDRIAKELTAQAGALGTDTLVNCASTEYFTAAQTKALKLTVITPQFLDEKNGQMKMISFFAKRARGAMARFIVERRLTDPAGIMDFDTGGYVYDASASTPEKPVFCRSEAAAQAA